jgi:hypothetical protein
MLQEVAAEAKSTCSQPRSIDQFNNKSAIINELGSDQLSRVNLFSML